MANIDVTAEHEKQVLFTKPYFSNSVLFIALKGSLIDSTALKGKKVGMLNDTSHQKYLSDKHQEINIIPYYNYQNLILDLNNGRMDEAFGGS